MIQNYPDTFGKCKNEKEVVELLASRTSLKRPQQPEDIAYGVLFLASDIASEITGQALIIDSGGIRR